METIRAFMAIPTPEEPARAIRTLVSRLKEDVPEARFVPPDQWHLTLHFFAALSRDQVDGVRGVARSVVSGIGSFPVVLRGLGAFPDARRPRVLWLGLAEGARECTSLHDRLASGLRSLGLPMEERPFRPHLTLARFRPPPPGGIHEALRRAPGGEVARFTAGVVILYRSVLTPSGAEHTVLDEFPLAGVEVGSRKGRGGG